MVPMDFKVIHKSYWVISITNLYVPLAQNRPNLLGRRQQKKLFTYWQQWAFPCHLAIRFAKDYLPCAAGQPLRRYQTDLTLRQKIQLAQTDCGLSKTEPDKDSQIKSKRTWTSVSSKTHGYVCVDSVEKTRKITLSNAIAAMVYNVPILSSDWDEPFVHVIHFCQRTA
jgi:hypothetical protein